jgi:hypothetical protein
MWKEATVTNLRYCPGVKDTNKNPRVVGFLHEIWPWDLKNTIQGSAKEWILFYATHIRRAVASCRPCVWVYLAACLSSHALMSLGSWSRHQETFLRRFSKCMIKIWYGSFCRYTFYVEVRCKIKRQSYPSEEAVIDGLQWYAISGQRVTRNPPYSM